MEKNRGARTIGQLRAAGYRPVSIRAEMRRNLIDLVRAKKTIFPGIIGYDDTVIPRVQNAIISGQDIIFLGERGQAKSRMMRSLVNLLDKEIPVVRGCEINDNPFAAVCRRCRDEVARKGDATEIDWLPREERYGEKLATPDTSMADLIGDVDPIKIAEGRYLSDELAIHYGLIPRTNRGIFCINELPDLTEKLQVGLFNLMEESDIQIRGYRVRLPLDILLVASANPEDYTNRGRIITPLKDRYGAQIRTHYPASIADEVTIMDMERRQFADDVVTCFVPQYIKEIIAEITHAARKSPEINQRSGVSVRVSIANYETVISNALRRAIVLGEEMAVPRITDLPYVQSSTGGKIEVEDFDDSRDDKLVDELVRKAVLAVFNRCYQVSGLEPVLEHFSGGYSVQVSDMLNARTYLDYVKQIPGMANAIRVVNDSERPEAIASAVELILEGLHLNNRLTKTPVEGRNVYRR